MKKSKDSADDVTWSEPKVKSESRNPPPPRLVKPTIPPVAPPNKEKKN